MSEAISDAFDRVRDKVKMSEKPKVPKVSPTSKASANTAGGGKKPSTDINWNLPQDKLFVNMAQRGLVSDE
jgi:hypothetical protein